MRILLLSKRQYTARDLLDDRYGRLYEIPRWLAARGHRVEGLVLSYRRRDAGWRRQDGISWRAVNALPAGLAAWPLLVRRQIRRFRPDLLWAASDVFHVIAGARLQSATGVPLVADLYDDYESFGAAALPGLRNLFREACSRAAGLTVVSRTLQEQVMARSRVPAERIRVVGNGVPEAFRAWPKEAARRRLGLPVRGRLVGTAGALTADRGIGDLCGAVSRLAGALPGLRLVVAGPRDAAFTGSAPEGTIDLGLLPHREVPVLLSALDVVVVCNRDTPFGRSCFPMKFHEALACGRPVVAAAVGDPARLLEKVPEALYPPGDEAALAERLRRQLARPVHPGLQVPRWSDLAEAVETFFLQVVAHGSGAGERGQVVHDDPRGRGG